MQQEKINPYRDVIALPLNVFTDTRLSLRQIRILGAIYAHADRHTGECHLRRDALAEITGYPKDRISAVTSSLVKLGWLEKTGGVGTSVPQRYRVPSITS